MKKSKFRESGKAIALDGVSHLPMEARRFVDGISQLDKVRCDKTATTETWKLDSVRMVLINKTTIGQFGFLDIRGVLDSFAQIAVGIQQCKEVEQAPISKLFIYWEGRLISANYSNLRRCVATISFKDVNHACAG
jgi:hypothetical protein